MPTPTDHPQPPPRSPFLAPAPRPQLPPAAPALQQRAWAALALAVLSLLARMLISNLERAAYVLAVTLVVALVALILAVSATSAAKRSGTRRPRGAVLAIVLGAVSLLFSGLALAGFLLFSAQFSQYATCMNAAGPVAARQSACQTQLYNSVGSEVSVLRGRLSAGSLRCHARRY
jgi:hypothetical protein